MKKTPTQKKTNKSPISLLIFLAIALFLSLQTDSTQALEATEPIPFLGTACPAGPWPSDFAENPTDYYYNACQRGELCNLGDQYYSIGDYVLDRELTFQAEHSIADPPNPKIIPHPYYNDYWDYVCRLDRCDSNFPSSNRPERDTQNWWCVTSGDDEPATVRPCPNFATTRPYCDLALCQENPGSSPYCDIDAIRYCDNVYITQGWYQCFESGWRLIYLSRIYPPGASGICRSQPLRYVPKMRCVGTPGDIFSGRWVQVPDDTPNQGRCINVNENLKPAFTPGYVRTNTPYLYSIWENTVNRTQAIFTPFRTRLDAGIYDWPGESYIRYDYTDDFAEAGQPPLSPESADSAKIYFRYLGFIHCAKENLLQKLSSILNTDQPYVYYDARCNAELW